MESSFFYRMINSRELKFADVQLIVDQYHTLRSEKHLRT